MSYEIRITVDYCFPCSSYICSFNKSSVRHLVLHSEQTKNLCSLGVSPSLLACVLVKVVLDMSHGLYIGIKCIKERLFQDED
jgi:hypothetical protein